jgi:hypothetical protein
VVRVTCCAEARNWFRFNLAGNGESLRADQRASEDALLDQNAPAANMTIPQNPIQNATIASVSFEELYLLSVCRV